MKFGPIQKPRQSEGNSAGVVAASLALAAALPALGADMQLPPNETPLTNSPRIDVPIPKFTDPAWGTAQNGPNFTFTGNWPAAVSNKPVSAVAREDTLSPAPEHIGPLRSAFHWIDQTLQSPTSWASNLAQLGSLIAFCVGGIYGIRSYRSNPQSMHTESIFFRKDKSPVFINAGQHKIKDLFGDLVERLAVYSAAHKATEKFPILFINPARYPEVVSELRSDLAAIDADTVVSALGLPADSEMGLRKWHLVIVPRKSFLGQSPIIMRDFFTFTNMVEMLDRPIEVFQSLKGMDRRHFVYHLEEAALVAHLHPGILNRAIKEAHIDRIEGMGSEQERAGFLKDKTAKLTANSKALLRLLCRSTEESLDILDAAVTSRSLKELAAVAPIEALDRMVQERREAKTFFEKTLEPLIHWVWKENNAKKVWLAARTPPEQLGLFECFTVAEMTTIETASGAVDTGFHLAKGASKQG